jgi:spore maturation protein SpmA
MLNYVWLALIFIGISVAITLDVVDQSNNKYMNGQKLSVQIEFSESLNKNVNKSFDVIIKSGKEKFGSFYKVKTDEDISQSAKINFDASKKEQFILIKIDDKSPAIWKEMAKISGKEESLSGNVKLGRQIDSLHYSASLMFENISFKRMKDVTNSVLSYASTAVEIALGLIGIMALWLGVMKVAEEAGLIKIIAKAVQPVTKFLFPEIPSDHPAIGAMIMNISANMLGLSNAATPFGLKAMEELDKLNPEKGTATNAMCTFLAINTAGLTLLPVTAIAIRATAGSSNPAIIIGTSVFGATCATIAGVTSAKILEKIPSNNSGIIPWLKSYQKNFLGFVGIVLALIFLNYIGAVNWIFNKLSFINADLFKSVINIVSILAIPLLIFVFINYGAYKKVKVYESFIEGAKEGFNVAVRIIPYLVAMLAAIGIFRAGGGMDFLVMILKPFTELIGMPAEALPMAIMRPLSGSGSLGVMAETIAVHGADSFIGVLTSTFFGSSETTFYVLAVYFGSVNIRKTRHALPVGLIADIAGVLGAVFIVRMLFGV